MRRRLAVFGIARRRDDALARCPSWLCERCAFASSLTVRTFAYALSLPPLKHCVHCAFAPYVAPNSLAFRIRWPLAYCACFSLGLVVDLRIKLCR
ncbi:MAG: hypothetical protein EGQ84_02685 [Slackia sp.]|nr:hypothetical protein [Slackia sp.]